MAGNEAETSGATASRGAIPYILPSSLIRYEPADIATELVEAKAAVLSLQSIPFQRNWVEELQKMELKREVAGTTRIEGAQFTDKELEVALQETPEQLHTRSQREVRAAVRTYRWIASLPQDRPVEGDLIREIHRRIVTGADDDRCAPGELRKRDDNVVFGTPRHRGVEGGKECERAFAALDRAIRGEYRGHDPLVQALAAHYHLAAMHPFRDGNGRTARALEALLLQRAGLRDTCFVAISNYYHDEKPTYLGTLSAVRAAEHDLTPFLRFGLRGIASQSRRLLSEIRRHVEKGLFRNLMYDLFTRLENSRARVIAERQIEILKVLLEHDQVELQELIRLTAGIYASLKNPTKALIRDLTGLMGLKAIRAFKDADGRATVAIRLEWPTEITESKFFEHIRSLPRAKSHSFLS